MHVLVLVELGEVDVDVDDGAVLGELGHLAGHAVVKAHAEGQQQVGLVHRAVRVVGAVHAEPLQRERVVLGETADAHESRTHRDVRQLGEFQQFLRCAGGNNAAAHIEHRLLRLLDQAEQFIEREVIRFLVGLVAAQFHLGRPDRLRLRHLHVLGNVHYYRTGPARVRDVEGFLHHARDVVRVEDEKAVLHHRQRHAEKVGFLECALADVRLRHLAGDRHDRDRIHVGVGQRGHEVRRARAARRHAHAHLAGRARVTRRHEAAALLVARQDGADLLRLGQRLVQPLARAAGIGENRIDALALQCGDEDVGSTHFGAEFRGRRGGRLLRLGFERRFHK